MSGISTRIIHAIPSDPFAGAISVPVFQTSTFIQSAPGVHRGFDQARTNNPTRKALEDLVAQLEYGQQAFAFTRGLAAIDSAVKLLSAGDEIVVVDDIWWRSKKPGLPTGTNDPRINSKRSKTEGRNKRFTDQVVLWHRDHIGSHTGP